MKEVTQEHLECMTNKQFLTMENMKLESSNKYLQKYLLILGILFYVVLTVAAAAIITAHKDHNTIVEYEQYMDQQEMELQDMSHRLYLLEEDNRLLQELGK